jgi:hypothetical protein
LRSLAASKLAHEATFGGATALSAVFLHHRLSEALGFFLFREPTPADLRPLAAALERMGFEVEDRPFEARRALVLVSDGAEVGHVDFAHFPYDPVDRPVPWRGLRVDSLLDMTINKLQAVLTRARARDFLDLYFLLRESPQPDVASLLSLVRAKFDVGPSPITLAERLLRVEEFEITDFPRLLRPVKLPAIRRFFEDLARRLLREGPG